MSAAHAGRRFARLVKAHVEDLCASGLTTQTILDAGIYSASSREVEALLGYGAGPGMVIPYDREGENGRPTYARVKLDQAGADGKRYRSPKGRGNRLYVPFTVDPHALVDVKHRLIITEGEKKRWPRCRPGSCASGCRACGRGVVGPSRTDPASRLMISRPPWSTRPVVLVFDSDAATNDDVRAAEQALAVELTRRGAVVTLKRLPMGSGGTKQGLDDFLMAHGRAAFEALPEVQAVVVPPTPVLTIIGIGEFIAQTFAEPEPLIEGILSDDGGGWLGGEEKTGKTSWMEAEATSLALAKPLAGRFTVPARRRTLILEEEDSPRRKHRRVRAVLRGHGVDPDDPGVQKELDAWLRISVWSGFSLDNPLLVARLDVAIKAFRPAVVYIDCLRKVTLKDLNKQDQAGTLLAILDDFRRRYHVVFRLVHHFRKQQGFRTGRGSQEIGGSFVLGAWGENSLFFEPVGRKQGAVHVEVQTKDGAPVPGFTLKIESEGPSHAPTSVKLVAEDVVDPHASDELVFQAVATLPKQGTRKGDPGVSKQALIDHLKLSESTIRRALKNLQDATGAWSRGR